MRKYLLIGFSMVFVILFAVNFKTVTLDGIYFPAYKVKVKPLKEQRIQAQIEVRNNMLRNVETGLVNPNDWYEALEKVTSFYNRISTRAGNIDWKEGGPLDVGGRSRGFIFDNQTPNKCYTSGVSGGIFESFDRGNTWKPVPGFDQLPVLSIGCMTQSINGDIYAGTGEYWGNDANGDFGSQFNGNGIYRKKAGSDNWQLLGLETPKNGSTTPQFSLVIDMGCDPVDNNKVFAATNKGLFVSRNGGNSWTKVSGVMSSGAISQIKPSSDPNIWYAGRDGVAYRSNDGGTTWTAITSGNYIANHGSRKHIRIAVSKQDAKKVYVCGIDAEAKLRFAIRSTDAGATWQLLGKQDALLQPLCSSDGTACQGWYDLCLAVNPSNDDHLFLGGQQAMYTWSPATNWVKAAFWTGPAKLGQNLVHADMHEFAFDEKNPDTLAICTDGGIYITYNAKSEFPNPTWMPKNKAFNITQFYDINASIYGELLGGAQDNGTNLIRTDASTDRKSFEVSGGDGFNTAISAYNDNRVMFYTVYNGAIRKTENMNASTTNPVVQGSCIDVQPMTQSGQPGGDGDADGVRFHTRIHVAEKLIPDPDNTNDTIDKEIPEKSLFFVMHPSGFYVSPNATKPGEKVDWTSVINPGVGEVIDIHQTKDLSTMYVVGDGGAKKITGFDRATFNKSTGAIPCLVSTTTGLGISISNVNGLPANLSGVYVRQSSPIVKPEVLVTQSGFGGTQKVFYSSDGNTFVNKQGDLPIMPVYCGIIDELNEKHVLIGTEYGVWETDDITAASVKWVPSSKNVGMVPVFRIRQVKLRKNGCWMVYLGTHGRGTFYAPITEVPGCSYNLNRPKVTSEIDPFANMGSKFTVFPNPTTDVLNVRFKSDKVQNYTISIYSASGQFVKKMSYRASYGTNTIPPIEVNMLSKGSYFVRLEDEEKVIGGSQFIVK